MPLTIVGNEHATSLPDHGMPAPLRDSLGDHTVATAYEMGWAGLDNRALLISAEAAFDAFVTTDQNLAYQQTLAGRRLAVLFLPTTSWPRIPAHIAEVIDAVSGLRPGEFRELTFRA